MKKMRRFFLSDVQEPVLFDKFRQFRVLLNRLYQRNPSVPQIYFKII